MAVTETANTIKVKHHFKKFLEENIFSRNHFFAMKNANDCRRAIKLDCKRLLNPWRRDNGAGHRDS